MKRYYTVELFKQYNNESETYINKSNEVLVEINKNDGSTSELESTIKRYFEHLEVHLITSLSIEEYTALKREHNSRVYELSKII